ncbi:MAG: tetratricopeptide repeat protein [Cryobacterium sp.]|nr:tetratricopeptide repeat protein [Oligoflexia bacterium]
MIVLAFSCTSQNPRDRFLLAERLWQEKNYPAAVAEYEKVTQKDPSSELGIKAALRAATTQTLFLNDHLGALRKLNRIIEANRDHPLAHEAYRQIGEILFGKLEQYEQAIQHYERMIELYPDDPAKDEYTYRIGKAQFHLLEFDDSIQTFRLITEKYPKSIWAKRARFEIAVSEQTKGHQLQQKETKLAMEAFRGAIKEFTEFSRIYPDDPLSLEAKFEIGNCYEELEQADAAHKAFEEILAKYPNRAVVEMKLKRIEGRRNQKKL